jgi:hypothetical protein
MNTLSACMDNIMQSLNDEFRNCYLKKKSKSKSHFIRNIIQGYFEDFRYIIVVVEKCFASGYIQNWLSKILEHNNILCTFGIPISKVVTLVGFTSFKVFPYHHLNNNISLCVVLHNM